MGLKPPRWRKMEIKKCLIESVSNTVFTYEAIRDLIDVNELDNIKEQLVTTIKELYPELSKEQITEEVESVIFDIKTSDTYVCYYDELPLVIIKEIVNMLSDNHESK
jgi:hypothetical protein